MAFDSELLKRLRLGVSDDRKHLVIRSAAGRGEITEYSFGIEEEYFLADKRTLDVAMETPNALFEAANWSTGGQAMREMLQAQLEVATNIHVDAPMRARNWRSCGARSRKWRTSSVLPSWPVARIRPRCGDNRSRARSRAMRR